MISNDSGVKFFDRKFVAANLQSELRCPKCSREYSYKHTPGKETENHRPFLLPCGHNMCEFCISKHRIKADFKCVVCFNSAPPTINTKDPKCAGNIRDYYELNYHVLGEVNSLDFYRRYAKEPVNKSLNCSTLSDVVLETKCSECNYVAANGECNKCNAFYCKRCFETVHNHSRVLKTHSFQRLENKKHQNKHIRVGNNIFRMPGKAVCSNHKKPEVIYCHFCKHTCCAVCTFQFHSNHKTGMVSELNQRYITEVPASINSIDAALLKLNNAQMVVKSTKKKLSDFADETLAGISKHFRFLHGQLQNAELRTIEMLRESSLPPQMQLNEAMSQLNSYEMVLNKLRTFLDPTNSQTALLMDVICLVHEHLEKIPTKVEVNKIDTNPYHFSNSIDNLSDMIKRHFVSQFVDPQIELRFRNEIEETQMTTISDITDPQESQRNYFSSGSRKKLATKLHPISASFYQQKNMKRYQAKRTHSNFSSIDDSDFELHTEQNKMLNNFSAMDISKPTESAFNKMVKQMGDWFKSDVLVHVRTINSPEDFYVQGDNFAQHIRAQLLEYSSSSECQTPDIIVVGQKYMVYLHKTESIHWQRALVIRKTGHAGNYNVFLPDIGLEQSVHSKDFRQLPVSLAMLPYAAVHCSLKQLTPRQGVEWEPEAAAFLKQVVQNYPVHVNILRALGPQFYEVDLITNNYKSTISVRESFLYTGLARSRDAYGQVQLSKPKQLEALQCQRLPRFEPDVGVVLIVQILNVEHPHEFYVMPHDQESKRQSLQNELQRIMNSTSLKELEPIYLGRLQLCCVINFEGHWHRACIERMLPKGYVQVRLVDSGKTQKLFWDQLFMLPDQFRKQEYGIKCCLADVETLQQHEYTWTQSSIAAFKQLVSNPKLQMEVIRVRDNVAHVSLNFQRSGSDSSNVGALLVAQGHCLSNGLSSQKKQKVVPVKTPLDADTRKLIELNKAPSNKLNSSTPAKKHKNERTTIEVIYVVNPNEFYVTLAHFMPAIADMRSKVQDVAAEMFERCDPKRDWQPGEMCYIRSKTSADMDELWHRGQIVAIVDEVNSKYDVKLRDIGELIKAVPFSSLTLMDENLVSVKNTAARCTLYGIAAKDAEWPLEAIEFFKAQLTANSALHATSHGREGDILCINLWGSYTKISSPFSPAQTKYVSINEQLAMTGWAVNNSNLDVKEPVTSANCSLTQLDDDSKLMACLESVDRLNKGAPLVDEPWVEPTWHNDGMPPLDLLNDLNFTTPTTGCAEAPLAWLTSRECKKSIFTAEPTNVNYECEIYLRLTSDKPFVNHMCKVLNKRFRPLLSGQKVITYVVGQPVLVMYHVDNQLYRGIVKSEINAKGVHQVYYVDYGNEEETMPTEMLPYAPFSQLKALCWPVTIYGVQPKEDKFSIKAMDTVHHRIVTKMCSIRVVKAKGSNGLPSCQIKQGGLDIATMMVDNDFAVRATSQVKNKKQAAVIRPETLESFKIFDELLQLGTMPSQALSEITNSTVQPPPAKKKLLMNSQQIQQQLDCEEDFDCREEALQQLQMSTNFAEVNDDSDNNDSESELKSVDGFSDDYLVEEEDEGIVNEEDENSAGPDGNQASYMPPQRISAIEQLELRIHLRNKEMQDNSHFSPKETSTERCYPADVSHLKPQNLPIGVKQFECRIDKVLSATELQISPQLTEFAKQEIVLAQETSVLIRKAKQLHPVKVGSLCLARFPQDNQWYRAIIEEINKSSQQATVFYIDFHDTEMVSFSDLKTMPKALFMFPQRSFRVKLHGIKLSKNFSEIAVRHSLQACLCKNPEVFARVHYPHNYHTNSDESSNDSDPSSLTGSVRQKFKQLEVDLYQDKNTTELIYKPLIDSRMYFLK